MAGELNGESDVWVTRLVPSDTIRLANIKSMFTKLCIDANCTLESRVRSFKSNKTVDTMCKECNVYQSVSHILVGCNNLELT